MTQTNAELDSILKKIYGKASTTNDKVNQVVGLAIEEWKNWLIARYRPDSITELNFDRVIKISLVMTGKYPEIDDLTFNFNLAPGHAQYIASRMRYKNYPELRKLAWESINKKLNDARTQLKKDQDTVIVVFSDWEVRELELVEKRWIMPVDMDYSPFKRKIRHGGFAWTCNMLPGTMDKLIEVITELLGQ